VRGSPFAAVAQLNVGDAPAAEDMTARLQFNWMARNAEAYCANEFAMNVDAIVSIIAFGEEFCVVLRTLENRFAIWLDRNLFVIVAKLI